MDIAGANPPADLAKVLDRTAEITVVPERRASDARRRARRWVRRFFAPSVATWHFLVAQSSSSLTRRIVLLNLAGLLALVLSILYLSQFRAGLIEARVQSLLVQGEIIAGAIAASATVETDTITIDPDKLFGRHVGVFGNTGSGKSKEARSVGARFIVLDPNGEYRECFKDLTPLIDVCVFSAEPKLGEKELIVPAWMWNGQEWAGAVAASPGTQRPILMQAIRHLRSSALAGGEARKPDNRLLFAGQLRAFLDYIRGRRAEGVLRQRILWRRHRDRRRGEEYHQPFIARQARQTDPVLPLGEPGTGRDERVVVHGRVRARRHGPCRRLHLL